MSARDVLLQIAQVVSVLAFAPLLQGAILQFEERVQRAQGPGLLQPYRDLWKLFHKQIVVPETASWIYWAAPIVAFTAMLTVPILIPVLTDFPLPLSDMGDILGGGLILTLGSFMVVLAGLDSGSAYGGIGSSRAVMVAILAEPTLILVFVGISLLAKAMLPFVVNHLLVGSPAVYWSPAHLFLVAAFFILLLVETDRLPIHSDTHIEVYMIDEARILEYSGPLLALLKWASMMKQFILYTFFLQRAAAAVGAVAPWQRGWHASLARRPSWQVPAGGAGRGLCRDRAIAAALLPLPGTARRFVPSRRIGDYRHSAVIMLLTQLDPLAASLFSATAIASLLLAFVMLGSRWLDNYLYAFAAQSWAMAALGVAVGYFADSAELYLIAALSALFRGLVLPYLIRRMIQRLHVARELHETLRPASALVIGALGVIFSLAVSTKIAVPLGLGGTVVVLALTVMFATALIGFLMLAIRQEAVSQIIGLLVLENGVRLGAQILIPGMPLLIELVILADVLAAVACLSVLVRYLLSEFGNASTAGLKRLVG